MSYFEIVLSIFSKWRNFRKTLQHGSHNATWQETHLHVRSVLCHLRPDRAYLFLRLLLLLISSPSTMSGREHRGVDMSFRVFLSEGEAGHSLVCWNFNLQKYRNHRWNAHMTWQHEWCKLCGWYPAIPFPGDLQISAWHGWRFQSRLWSAACWYEGREEGGNHTC